ATNALLESGGTGAGQTLRWKMRLHRPGAPALELNDVVVGDGPVGDLATGVSAPLRFLFNNPFSRLALDSVEIAVSTESKREQWTLRSARIIEASVRPHSTAHIACEIEGWRGNVLHRTLSLEVPSELPDGRYVVWVGGGTELTRYEAARLPG